MTPQDVIDVLNDCDDFLDNYVDVNDGDDGRPVANRAMGLQAAVRQAVVAIEREQDRVNNKH